MYLILTSIATVLISFFAFGTFSANAEIEPALQRDIAAGKEQVEVLIHMKERADTEKVALQIRQNSPARFAAGLQKDVLRYAVLEELQQTAAMSQSGLISYLEEMSKAGLVEKIESYYISNIVYARLDAKLVRKIAARPDVRHVYANSAVDLTVPSPEGYLYDPHHDAYTWNLKQINVPAAWGGPLGDDPWFMEIIENWRNANIFPAFAAGNSGAIENSINNPANYPDSFAVGAVDSGNSLTSFSSRGPGIFGDMIKPEVVAPGNKVISVFPYGISTGSGTSFAVPHVAGAVALMLEADSSLQLNDLEEILKKTALSLTDDEYPDSPNYGYGLIDVLSALDYVVTHKWIELDGPQEAVPLDESWRINFNRSYSPQEIAGIAIDSNNGVVPIDIDYQPDEKIAIVTPQGTYQPAENYELRIYLDNEKRYRVYFETVGADQAEQLLD